ncbi:succinate dehydrogenase [Rhodococcus sp. TAF43]|uniref:succinate dehydrogenase n=1 Tax=unclassified Rhodococcus (in: high G+C Gram-positive bacteria) TaxID=192944 RepID=UPI001581A028|nr:succinate dehydrogenase [Rhodococcus sp. W8901]QKT12914.1 succinate dehydrogenase [Rhodococcus sp. W8901]
MPVCRVNWWTALGAGILLAVVGIAAGRFPLGVDASVAAGRQYGANQAVMYMQFNPVDPTDEQLHQWCRQGAELSAGMQVWYDGGVIQVGELDRTRFAEGCFESYRDGVR